MAAGRGRPAAMRLRLLRQPRRALLRTRVLVGVLLVTMVVLAAFDVAGVTALRSYLIGQTDSGLRQVIGVYRLTSRLAAASQRHRPEHPPPYTSPPVRQSPGILESPFLRPYTVIIVSGETVQGVSPTVSLGNGVIIANAGLKPSGLPGNLTALASSGQAWTAASAKGNQPLRLMAGAWRAHTTIEVMTSLDGVDKTVGRLELILVIGSVAAGLLAAGGVAWIMRRGLRPIETMAGQADAISAGDLTGRVGPQDPRTEVGRLGVALNGMLARIEDFISEREASQEATRRFFADASHELRTPLASLRANAELYQQGALTERYQVDEAMRRIVIESQRMGKLVDDMLRLAQHPGQQCDPVDLTALVSDCFDEAAATDPWRTWRADIADDLATLGDAELLRRAISNLLSNVSTHTPDGTTATVTAGRQNGTVTISVSDNGPGVPPDQVHRIFDRFYRGTAPSPRPGAG